MEDRKEKGSPERAAYWQERLREQEASGLSTRQFCRSAGLALSQFYYWRRRLRGGAGEAAGAPNDPAPAFVELGLGGSVSGESPSIPLEIRLDLGAGCVLSIRRG